MFEYYYPRTCIHTFLVFYDTVYKLFFKPRPSIFNNKNYSLQLETFYSSAYSRYLQIRYNTTSRKDFDFVLFQELNVSMWLLVKEYGRLDKAFPDKLAQLYALTLEVWESCDGKQICNNVKHKMQYDKTRNISKYQDSVF